ncbi:hypothetical protein Tco_1447764 [Tanacetum coccineum]
MTTLKFADTHNMIVFLAKPVECEGFEQIVDFLNVHTIKQKTINGDVQLQALVDGKKIIITESIVRRDLQLEDAEGVDCLPNATIFEQLTLIGYEKLSQKLTFYKAFFSQQWKFLIHTILQCLSAKTTAWNEFSSTMASVIICLAINQKFNFSKYIFESMVKNLENVSGKFLMYPRFVQVFVNQQLEGMPTHKRIYITPSHTKKIFRNMRRVGIGFSGRETPDGTSSTRTGSCPRLQDTMGDTIARTRFKNMSKTSNDSLLAGEDASKQRRKIDDIDKDVEITLVHETLGRCGDEEIFDTGVLDGDEEKSNVVEEPSESITITPTLTTTTATIVTTASTRPKAKRLVIHEEEQATTPTVSSQQPSQVKAQDKGKGIMVEEPVKMKKKYQISLDEELAFKLQAEEEEEERLTREKAQRETI